MEFVQDKDVESVEGPTSHRGATAVTAVFFTVAVVVFWLGLIGAVWMGVYAHQDMAESVGRSIAYTIAVALSGIFMASVLAFFGYVLDLLTEIEENTRP